MCGIFGYIGKRNDTGAIILNGLKCLEYRGYDSWGMALKKEDGNVYIEKHTGKIGKAHVPAVKSSIGIGHTRWATHGGVTVANTHPHTDCKQKAVVVHNGIIENYRALKDQLIKQGHTFVSETDSETVAHLIEEYMKKGVSAKNAVLKTFTRLQGMSAIIVFFPVLEEFYAVKNGSPLVFGKGNDEAILASDTIAILPFTNKVYFLEDNELLRLDRDGATLSDLVGNDKKISFTKVNYQVSDTGKGAYPNYMIKEISEQPQVLRGILDTQTASVIQMAQVIRKSYGTYFIGCGSAFYVCMAGAYLFSIIAKKHVNCWSAAEFAYLVDFLKNTSLVAAISQSGETMDVISSVKSARSKQAKIMAITNTLGSTLYRASDYKMLVHAGPEICVVSTKVVTAKIALLYLLAYELQGNLDKGKSELEKAVTETARLIKDNRKIKALAGKYSQKEHIFIIGRGVSYAAALEAALKIKEVSYIHAEGFAAGELKHGVIALIEKGTPVIIFNPEDETYNDTLSSAAEVKARGAFVIGISGRNNPVYDEYIPIKYCGPATVIPNIVFAQIFAYYLAKSRHLDTDKPRNLAKSVTVK